MGTFVYWQHTRHGDLYAVAFGPTGHVERCAGPLPHREIARDVRADLRPWPELCALLEAARARFRRVSPVQVELTKQQGGPLPPAAGAWPALTRTPYDGVW